jgi:hypothetical protein
VVGPPPDERFSGGGFSILGRAMTGREMTDIGRRKRIAGIHAGPVLGLNGWIMISDQEVQI